MSRLPALWSQLVSALVLVATAVFPQAAADETLEPVPAYANFAGPLVETYCFGCHSGDEPEAGLAMHNLDGGEHFTRDREQWKKVLERVRAGNMPPEGYDTPTSDERMKLIEWIEARLAEFDCSGPRDPGWVTLRRLNRDQYKNTIRDLLKVDFEPSRTFPPDDLAYGFDNNADMLSLTTTLLEKYLDAARDISKLAILPPESLDAAGKIVPRGRWEGGHHDREDARELSTVGAIEFEYDVPVPGRYAMRATVSASQAGDEPVQMAFLAAGAAVQTVSVFASEEEEEKFAATFDLPAGKHRLGVAFLNDYYNEGDIEDRNLFVRRLEIVGPLERLLEEAPAAQREWFAAAPTPDEWRDDLRWRPGVEKILASFSAAAYRRPPPQGEIDRLMSLVDARRMAGDTYERAMQITLQAMLVSPRFLFIGNVDEPPRQRDSLPQGYLVDEYELASRLSYFLWSSMPDAQLLQLAGEGQLRGRLEDEVTRMLRDERIAAFTSNFTGQWLGIRQLAEFEPDESQFSTFNDALRAAMVREAQMVFAEVLQRDLPITTLLDAEFTYLNQRLAQHYGIKGVRGEFFRRVAFADVPGFAGVRGGVLSMAGVLATTSNPDRTSPVKRGKWVLGELLGAEPPAPPPGIQSLDEVARKHSRELSIREQMELHRSDPSCAVCHEQMDAIGLALENYDVVGRWREEDTTGPIDSTGELPTGEQIDGAAGLRQVLLDRRDAFRECLTEKMLTYALGRGLEYYDECAVFDITNRVEQHDDRLRSLVMAIVESPPFQRRRYNVQP